MKIEGATDAQYTPDTSEEGYWYYFVVATNTVNKAVNMTTSDIVEIYVDPNKKIRRRKKAKKTRMGKG